ncbi:MAG TPA: sigma-70 family RNA polymerase sigma factor, partial [Chloroflexota bacterium]|nr:sigma-70 family RNA polymerase sigma factor [Chloroflexota bacterium]
PPRSADLDALYRAHVRAIFAFIYSRVGNREAAEDLTGDVFMKALSHLDPSRAEASIMAWLFRVAHNVVNDYWRVTQRASIIALDEARALREPRPSAENPSHHEQTAARAAALLAALPENYRTVLSCRLLQGMSVAETAAQMGISEANVKVLQHRALKRAAELREDGTRHER